MSFKGMNDFQVNLSTPKNRVSWLEIRSQSHRLILSKPLRDSRKKNLSITYLDCPLFYGKRVKSHFSSMVVSIQNKISSWSNKLLSTGGKIALIRHVLSSLQIHMVAVLEPPKSIIHEIEMLFANFLWGYDEGEKKCTAVVGRIFASPQRKGE